MNTKKILNKLTQINEQFFLSQEIFPCNKAVNMPYHNMNATMEYAFDENNSPVMIGRFVELAKQKQVTEEEFSENLIFSGLIISTLKVSSIMPLLL